MSGALADVLAAITDRPVGHWRAEVASPAFLGIDRISSRGVQWRVRVEPYRSTTQTRRASLRQTEPVREARRVGNTLVAVEVSPAHTITPAEATEMLYERGLWPWEPGEAWWGCDACSGSTAETVTLLNGSTTWIECRQCRPSRWGDALGRTTEPPSHAALVAVASLGRPQLLRITHTLAPVIARAAGCPDARVVWRVMEREAIKRHHGENCVGWDVSLPLVFSREMTPTKSNDPRLVRRPWSGECPFSGMFGTPEDDHHGVHAAWPALRALAVGDEATPQPTGVHLVALDASRIVLAVEAIGGDRG